MEKFILNNVSYESDKYFLGVLCKKAHTYNGQDQSVRLKSNRACIICRIEYKRNDRKKNKYRDMKFFPTIVQKGIDPTFKEIKKLIIKDLKKKNFPDDSILLNEPMLTNLINFRMVDIKYKDILKKVNFTQILIEDTSMIDSSLME